MVFSKVYTFGDSLVDAGNALKLAEFYGSLPFTRLPDGAPTADKGYFDGRFSNGYTFADLVTNKLLGVVSQPIFPYGFEDPLLGISFRWMSDPDGNNLNFAYGGAQIRQGGEVVPDLGDQTAAFDDAVDGDAGPGSLALVTMGGNDVRSLVPDDGAPADLATATARLQAAADELIEEVGDLIDAGVRTVLITGIPDVGIVPDYNGVPNEAALRAAATQYSTMLQDMVTAQLAALRAAHPTADIRFFDINAAIDGHVDTLLNLYDPSALLPLNESGILFFDFVHPTAQAHALLAASALDALQGTTTAESLPIIDPDLFLAGSIGTRGEADSHYVSLAANVACSLEMLGISSGNGSLADPLLKVYAPDGSLVFSNDDGGVGLDAQLGFTPTVAGDYRVELSAVGMLTGSYAFGADAAATGDNLYRVSHGNALIMERPGEGTDVVLASVDYRLAQGVSIERLATDNDAGKAAIDLYGNEYSQTIVGNAGNNLICGGGGIDVLWGLAGKDGFVFSSPFGLDNIDSIADFVSRDDTIYLDDALFDALGMGVIDRGEFRRGSGARDADDHLIYDPANGHLYYDPDGNGSMEQIWFATLSQNLRVTAADFEVAAGLAA